jgi:phospholipid/cholesterol/gamma-HCH transport system ATP-binding protein
MSLPVLDIDGAQPDPDGTSPLHTPVHLCLMPGELALVNADDPGMARALAELCAGLPKLAAGRVRVLGKDMAALRRAEAEAIRARIGIAPGRGGWLPHLSVEEGMLLARRHHGDMPEPELRRQADGLARHFGFDGVPEGNPHDMSDFDLARAACARAFLGRPALLLLESPLDAESADALVGPLRAVLDPALGAGAAALWVTRSRIAWEDPDFPATQRLVLERDWLFQA